jgi:hypothetical protein
MLTYAAANRIAQRHPDRHTGAVAHSFPLDRSAAGDDG